MTAQTIQFAMLNESGHINPTFKLSKALSARGYQVRYLAGEDVAETITEQGFAVDPLYPDLFARGALAAEQALGRLAQRRAITARYRTLLDRLATGSPLPAQVALPKLWVVDVTQTQIAYWARRVGVPFVYVNTSLPQTEDPGVPPLRSGAPYGATTLGRVAPALAWRRFVAQRRLSARVAALGGMCPPYELARTEAWRFGVAPSSVESRTMYMPQLRGVPELVLCPDSFDFPRAPNPLRHYVESIDLSRAEPAFAWERVASDKPLVYCALGGQRYRADQVPAFFARLVEVFRQRPSWQLVLAVGPHVDPQALNAPANVIVLKRAPQLSLLARATLMITHGGLGSVKECVTHGVPMLGVPLDVDQPGNVARLVHHGLGLAADVQKTSTEELGRLISRALLDDAIKQNVQAMKVRFERHEAGTRGADLIARYASGSP